jgi:hypothetical protein
MSKLRPHPLSPEERAKRRNHLTPAEMLFGFKEDEPMSPEPETSPSPFAPYTLDERQWLVSLFHEQNAVIFRIHSECMAQGVRVVELEEQELTYQNILHMTQRVLSGIQEALLKDDNLIAAVDFTELESAINQAIKE